MEKIEFLNNNKEMLRGVLHVPKKYNTAVIFLHGFPSRISGFTGSRIVGAMKKSKHLFMVFDFSGTDSSEGKFENKLVSQEVKEIKYAINFLDKKYGFKKLVLVGHSTGAIDAALYGYGDPRVSKMVLIGGTGDLKHGVQYEFTPVQVRDFWKKGWMRYDHPGKWYHGKKLLKRYYDEFFTLDVLGRLRKFRKPVLVVHAENDEAVPMKDAKELFQAAGGKKKLVVIRDADHRFSKKRHFLKLLHVVNKFIDS